MATMQSQVLSSPLEDRSSPVYPTRCARSRLIVVASIIEQEPLLAARILALATARGLDVLLFGLAIGAPQEDQIRRSLALLAAFVRDAGVSVEVQTAHGGGWLAKLTDILGSGDLLACPGAATPPGSSRSLVDLLSSRLRLPVHVLDVSDPVDAREKAFLPGLLTWLLSIAIILGFLWLQIRISQSSGGSYSTLLLIALLPLEIALIWFCNSLFS